MSHIEAVINPTMGSIYGMFSNTITILNKELEKIRNENSIKDAEIMKLKEENVILKERINEYETTESEASRDTNLMLFDDVKKATSFAATKFNNEISLVITKYKLNDIEIK